MRSKAGHFDVCYDSSEYEERLNDSSHFVAPLSCAYPKFHVNPVLHINPCILRPLHQRHDDLLGHVLVPTILPCLTKRAHVHRNSTGDLPFFLTISTAVHGLGCLSVCIDVTARRASRGSINRIIIYR